MAVDKIPLLGPSKARILREMTSGERTAKEVAASLEIQVSAARRHLEGFRAMGFVEERFVRRGRGRPKKVFRLTEEGRELLPRRYDAVLDSLLERLTADNGEAGAERILRRVAKELAEADVRADKASRVNMRPLMSRLDELGFQPSLVRTEGEYTVESHNCPILKIAKVHRELVCRGLHEEIIRMYAGGSRIRREKWIVNGDALCTHIVPRGRRHGRALGQ